MAENDLERSKKRWIIPSLPGKGAVSVPCGSCQRCCQGNSLVAMVPEMGDDPESYATETFGPLTVLKRKANGDCFYLGATGCVIHARAPYMCKIFDCRAQHRMYSKVQRDQLIREGKLDKEVMRRGATLIHRQEKDHKLALDALEDEVKQRAKEIS